MNVESEASEEPNPGGLSHTMSSSDDLCSGDPSSPASSPALQDCLSPGSAQKAMASGALQAEEEHRDQERRRSIEEDEGLWVRSVSGEHQMDARKSIYLQNPWDIYYDGGFQRGMTDEEWAASVKRSGVSTLYSCSGDTGTTSRYPVYPPGQMCASSSQG